MHYSNLETMRSLIPTSGICHACLAHPGWASPNEARRSEPRDLCRTCYGSGTCQKCDGAGEVECRECDGIGAWEATTNGDYNCPIGTEVVCGRCFGAGYVDCPACTLDTDSGPIEPMACDR